ncbi:hypothetical protein Clocl_0673 [Acetivibrio clariflavus DSM 19732]|uniref:Uncharacterized protein n=1 Tax=Acetivibrio clariflavus (strain DSM 19732 / NBRC 101661 / EBR45) TaxID=720554 RepID=G8LUP0_ACECE|nr:hypothetical protein Clocl_0673 [Acetivibrio clariflavus DSM 19732]
MNILGKIYFTLFPIVSLLFGNIALIKAKKYKSIANEVFFIFSILLNIVLIGFLAMYICLEYDIINIKK